MKSPGIEKQDALFKILDNQPIQCPSCRDKHTVEDIAKNYKTGDAGTCECPITGEQMTREFTLFGGEQFFRILNPVSKH